MRFLVAVVKRTNAFKLFLISLAFCFWCLYIFVPSIHFRLFFNYLTETQSKIKPIFVIRTFYYPNSKTFNGSDAVVILFNGEQYNYNRHKFICWRLLKDGNTERSVGNVLNLLASPGQCKLGVMRLTCLFPVQEVRMVDYSVGVLDEDGIEKFKKLTVSTPYKKPYKFVACMSRMVAVDDWAMVIFAMEAFRYFGGDLAVAPVECAIKEVMKLLRLYEKDGILKVQPAFKPKQIPELFYNTLYETEYSNQISNSHECFYEFKESAEFISFPDWDDVLMGSRHENGFQAYYDMFAPLIHQQPNAAAFSLNRYDSTLLTPVHELMEFSIATIFRKAVYNATSGHPKMVIRPLLVASCWIHTSKVMENAAYSEIETSVASFAHLNYTLLAKHNKTVALNDSNLSFLDPDVLDSSFRSMLERQSFDFKNANYPFVRPFYELIYDCYSKMIEGWYQHGVISCPSTASCKYNVQNVTVVKAKTTYKEPFISTPFLWIERNDTSFVIGNQGCF